MQRNPGTFEASRYPTSCLSSARRCAPATSKCRCSGDSPGNPFFAVWGQGGVVGSCFSSRMWGGVE